MRDYPRAEPNLGGQLLHLGFLEDVASSSGETHDKAGWEGAKEQC